MTLLHRIDRGLDRPRAVLLLVATSVLWSLGGMFIKLIDWNPLAIGGARAGLSAVALLLFSGRPRFHWTPLHFAGGLAYTGTVVLFVVATKLTTAANAILLQYTAPVYIALFSAWFLKERISRVDWISIGVVLGGLFLFFMDRIGYSGVWGNVTGILSGISFGWLTLILRRLRHGSPVEIVILGNTMAAVLCLPFMFRSPPGIGGWSALLFMGFIQLGFSYLLYTLAIKHVRALEAMLIPMMEPILNPVWVFLTIGEVPGPWSAAGGVLVLSIVGFQGFKAIGKRTARRRSEQKTKTKKERRDTA